MKKLVFASNNKSKIKEVASIFEGTFEIVPMSEVGYLEDIEETGSTFFENSLIKAKAVHDFCHLPVIADDSGLMVDYLNGEPGVFSARYAGDHDSKKNNAYLLEKLKGVDKRDAKFVCVITFIDESGKVIQTVGETFGTILEAEDGNGGFGYDPLFYSNDLQKSFGRATASEKDLVSHRYRALMKLCAALKNN